MSNKKVNQTPYVVQKGNLDGTAPPRYQPPPLPPSQQQSQSQQQPQQPATSVGILKHQHPQPVKDPSLANKSAYPGAAGLKPDLKHPYSQLQQQQQQQQAQPKSYVGYMRPMRPPYEEQTQQQHHHQQDLIRVNTQSRSQLQQQQQQHHQVEVTGDGHRMQRYPVPVVADDDFHRIDMLKFVRKSDVANENANGTSTTTVASNVTTARHMQNIMAELRVLKEANQRLADDNQELRDLCCFLDDDRQKGRKLAREWQRFGRYTASVMRQEVSAYQSKLRELDNKQQELIKDNLELKELCLYLDEERSGGASVCPSCGSTSTTSGALRDDGDGSSSSTNADEPGLMHPPPPPPPLSSASTQSTTQGTSTQQPAQQQQQQTTGVSSVPAPPRRSTSRERLLHENLARQQQRSTFNDQTMQYVRSLEHRVKQLEDEKRSLQHKIAQLNNGNVNTDALLVDTATPASVVLSNRPEAVVRALQVLEVREQLEREARTMMDHRTNANNTNAVGAIANDHLSPCDLQQTTSSMDMDDGEKALVREMCNVVWRKLEEGPQSRR